MPVKFFTPLFVFKAILLLFGSLAIISWGLTENYASSASQRWPSIQGTILLGQVVERQKGGGLRSGSLSCYSAQIRYTYTLNHTSYHNDTITYHGSPCVHGAHGQRLARETLARYPLNKSVSVFYDPNNPAASCLEPGRTYDGTGLIMFGGALFIFFLIYTGGRALDRYGAMGDFAPKRHDRPPIP